MRFRDSRNRHPDSKKLRVRQRFAAVYNAADGICVYCGTALTPEEGTEDHVVPLSKGGRNHISNVVLACSPCNVRKGNDMWRDPRQTR